MKKMTILGSALLFVVMLSGCTSSLIDGKCGWELEADDGTHLKKRWCRT